MSFSAQVKEELCRIDASRCCQLAECMGIALYCNTCSGSELRIITESVSFAQRLPELFKHTFNLSFDQLPDLSIPGKRSLIIQDPKKLRIIYDGFGFDLDRSVSLHLNRGLLEDDHCRAAFLRGVFWRAVPSPTRISATIWNWSPPTAASAARSTPCCWIWTFRPSRPAATAPACCISSRAMALRILLTTMGAPSAPCTSWRPRSKRICATPSTAGSTAKTANLTKVVDAAQEQVAAIEQLMRSQVWDTLPDKLRATAKAPL